MNWPTTDWNRPILGPVLVGISTGFAILLVLLGYTPLNVQSLTSDTLVDHLIALLLIALWAGVSEVLLEKAGI